MSIPKKIHYIWVGNNKKTKDVKYCINTWKKKFKNFEKIWLQNPRCGVY